ncbi:lipocalin family protein [Shewanella sp. YIC-542]|uniref:lipocalin family protein n=1 Tax=Shewanella mytili TaxID=3377111 RepID=UPI00398E7141
MKLSPLPSMLRCLASRGWLWGCLLLSGCTLMAQKIAVVEDFQTQAYLGQWYEIARLDHGFERDLTHVQAHYRLDGDAIRVTNTGYNPKTQAWQTAKGVAYFMEGEKRGRLRVSFFRPFYGAYQIHALIPQSPVAGQYQHAVVMGPSNQYLWLLSRQPQVDDAIKQRFVNLAQQLEVAPSQLIWVVQSPKP